MIEIFCSCAQEDQKYLIELGKHLKVLEHQQTARWWHVSHILAGADPEAERDRHLNSADIILLLVSPYFINSPSYEQEMQPAMKRHEQGKARVIPILLRRTYLEEVPFHGLKSLPSDGRPISEWRERDAAFTNVVEGIVAVLRQIRPGESRVLPPSSDISTSIRPAQTWSQSLEKALFEHFKEFRYLPKLTQFQARARRHKRSWKRLQWVTVGIAVATWLFVLVDLLILNSPPLVQILLKFLAVISATLLIACTLLMATSYAHDRWLNYLQRVDDLKREENMYYYKVEAYANDVDRERLFMSRINTILEKGEAGTKSSTNTDDHRPPQIR